MLWLYRNSSLVASLWRKCDGAHRGQTQKAAHIQLHQAKNEQPEGEKLQSRAAWIHMNFIESFDCHLRVIRPVLIAKSKGERFEVQQVETQERRRSARKHYIDSQPPKMRRNRLKSDLSIKREKCRDFFESSPLRYIPDSLRGGCYRKLP